MAGPLRVIGPLAPVPAALLLAAWLAWRLYPFVPVIDLHKYLAALRGAQRPLIPYDSAAIWLTGSRSPGWRASAAPIPAAWCCSPWRQAGAGR